MRFSIPIFIMVGALLASPSSFAQSSFGPEISAEDFHQHLSNLATFEPADNTSTDYAEMLRRAYLDYQFIRLGLQSQPADCAPLTHSLQAVLPGSEAGTKPVMYVAHWQMPAEIAAVLEIAERFMTQRPRPKHSVVFLFSPNNRTDLSGCALATKAKIIIQPVGMETHDASSLVSDLNAMYRQGK